MTSRLPISRVSWVRLRQKIQETLIGRLNLERPMTFVDGSFLDISVACLTKWEFSCTAYSALERSDRTAFCAVSNPLPFGAYPPECPRRDLLLGSAPLPPGRRVQEETSLRNLAKTVIGKDVRIRRLHAMLSRLVQREETHWRTDCRQHKGGFHEFR